MHTNRVNNDMRSQTQGLANQNSSQNPRPSQEKMAGLSMVFGCPVVNKRKILLIEPGTKTCKEPSEKETPSSNRSPNSEVPKIRNNFPKIKKEIGKKSKDNSLRRLRETIAKDLRRRMVLGK